VIDDGRASRRLVVAIADGGVLQTVSRLANMAGFAVEAVPTAALAVASSDAPVVCDVESARALVGPPPDARLIVVSGREPRPEDWRVALAAGARRLVVLPQEQQAFLESLHDTVSGRARGRLVCVLPGRGGAGASVLSATLALALASGDRQTMLLDLDPSGGGQELLLGLERSEGCRWSEVLERGLVDAAAVSAALPVVAGVSVLTGDAREHVEVAPAVVRTFVSVDSGRHEWVVADLPRRREIVSTALPAADLAVVVVTPDVRGVAAAVRLVDAARALCRDVRAVVRCPERAQLRMREVAATVGVPVIAGWGWDRRTGQIVDAGTFAGRWRSTTAAPVAAQVINALAEPDR